MRVSVVVPTYNERENIGVLIELLDKHLKGFDYEVVVVDDNSPDGTAEVAEELAKRYPVKVVKRPGKLGLASAIFDGINASSGDVIVVMDADLQHPPELVPALLERLGKCDLVIASRYVRGGRIEEWSLLRKVFSVGAVLLARLLVPGCFYVKDPVSGFFAIKRGLLRGWKPIEPRNYKVLVELLKELRGARVCEVPYVFKGRRRGTSKLSKSVIAAYVKVLIKLGFLRLLMALLAILLIAFFLLHYYYS
ncbi:MAG: polyprenol monophosphomannose synthase [Desulfurococcaceae archaeon]